MPTVNLASNSPVDPLDSIFSPDFLKSLDASINTDPERVPYFKDDPFVLAVAAWRTTVESNFVVRWPGLSTLKPTDADRQRAQEMKRYYRDRVMVRALKNTQLTKFSQDLYDLMLTEEVREKHMGMLLRLPFFYQEDLDYDDLTARVVPVRPWAQTLQQALTANKEIRKLTPVKKIFHSRKSGEYWQYWFTDDLEQPVLWTVRSTNALISVVDGLFKEPACVIEAFYHTGQLRGLNFAHFYLSGPRIVF